MLGSILNRLEKIELGYLINDHIVGHDTGIVGLLLVRNIDRYHLSDFIKRMSIMSVPGFELSSLRETVFRKWNRSPRIDLSCCFGGKSPKRWLRVLTFSVRAEGRASFRVFGIALMRYFGYSERTSPVPVRAEKTPLLLSLGCRMVGRAL